MMRYGLIHNGKKGRSWCIPLLNDREQRLTGLWEVVHLDQYSQGVIDTSVPLSLAKCAEIIRQKHGEGQ